MCVSRRATEVEEQTENICILSFFQSGVLECVNVRLIASDVVTAFAEEVGVTAISEFYGHAWARWASTS